MLADSGIPYTTIDALKWIEQAAAALAYMHATQPRETLHRDLKPANILLFDNRTVAKLADFGLARVMSDTTLTKNIGTHSYMAPEVRNFSNLIERF